MGRAETGRTPMAAQRSQPATSNGSADSPHQRSHSRKKRKLIISETETTTEIRTRTRTQSLTLARNSARASASHAHIHANCYTYTSRSHNEKRHRRKRPKPTRSEDNRKWVYSTCDTSQHKEKIVLMSYNILGVENALKHPDLYQCVKPEYLDWEYRKRVLHKEINDYGAGILCFQEVDNFDDLDNLLQRDGYKGIYQARTGEACDGCAIFWKSELFNLLHEENIEFQRFGLRNNVAQLCVFEMNNTGTDTDLEAPTPRVPSSRSFVVGNIHVLFNPNRGDIKLGQMRMFLEMACKLSQDWGSIPVVLCGDLNSMPQSAVYQFLASAELDVQEHDRREISGQICTAECLSQSQIKHKNSLFKSWRPMLHRWSDEELVLATGSRVSKLRHGLNLHSAYPEVPGNSRTRDRFGEPLATSYHSKFMGTVDYIWHTPDFVPVRVLESLPVDILRRTRGLPSKKWGSDHLALVCELAFARR